MKRFKDALKDLSDMAQSNMTIKDGLDQLKKTVDDGLQVAKSQFDGMNENSQEQYSKIINEVLVIIPMLEALGYQTEQFLVHITIPPSIEIHLKNEKHITKEQLEDIQVNQKDNYLFVKMAEALYRAGQLQKTINSGSLQSKGIHISMGVPPRVSLVYAPVSVNQ